MKLVTGNEGFIGKNLWNRLLDDFKEPMMGIDVNDVTLLRQIVESGHLEDLIRRSDGIYHLGANSSTQEVDPSIFYVNYEFTKAIIDLAQKHDKKVVFASSASVYGNNRDMIPKNLYAWTKKLCEDYGIVKYPNFIALRYFNVYGPHEDNKGKMASVGYQAYKNDKYMKLFPGSPMRDFVYVDDVVDATIYCMEKNVHGGWYDVGSCKASLFEEFLNLMNCKFDYRDVEKLPNGYQMYTKATVNDLPPGWEPKYDLEAGCKKYLEYLENE